MTPPGAASSAPRAGPNPAAVGVPPAARPIRADVRLFDRLATVPFGLRAADAAPGNAP